MNPKIKNIILFIVIAIVMISVYVFFIKKDPEEANLITTSEDVGADATGLPSTSTTPQADSQIAKDFLAVLLSVKSISLDDSIFSDVAFTSLRDSSILLTPDGNEGRPNPFAPIGSDLSSNVINTITSGTAPASVTTPESIPVSPLTDTGATVKPNNTSAGSKPAN